MLPWSLWIQRNWSFTKIHRCSKAKITLILTYNAFEKRKRFQVGYTIADSLTCENQCVLKEMLIAITS